MNGPGDVPEGDRAPVQRWRYEEQDAAVSGAPERPVAGDELVLNVSWFRLQLVHSAFRATAQAEYQHLLDRLRELERLVLARVELEQYYHECFAPLPGEGSASRPRDPVPAQASAPREVRHMAALQTQLMENAFFVLRLDRYANAPDNRGWMNLFRRWGRSAAFNSHFDELRPIITTAFVDFYDLYLRFHPLPIDESPVPHPWDVLARRRDPRTASRHSRGAEATAEMEPEAGHLPGIFLDSGVREVASPRKRSRVGERPLGPDEEGMHGNEGAAAGTPLSPRTGADGGGGGGDSGGESGHESGGSEQ